MSRMNQSWAMLLAAPGVVMVAPAPVLGGQTYLHEADAARAIFPESTTSERRRLDLSDVEVAELSKALGRRVDARSYAFLEVRGEKGPIGFIFMLDIVGETLPISFAIGVTADGALQDVQVMVYREPQGEAIQEKRFRKQFVGKRSKDPITLDKDIDAISGATISSRAATFAARKGLLLAEVARGRASAGGKP
jgi:Na+-translocating ferredoxin:NAD+ oxidoreductase RnfG subunit